MTLFRRTGPLGPAVGNAPAAGVLLLLVLAMPVDGRAGQRARPRAEAPTASVESRPASERYARPRDAESRSAEPTKARDEAPPRNGPMVVAPSVAVPAFVGGFPVGKPVVVGQPFIVGGPVFGSELRNRDGSRAAGSVGSVGIVAPVYAGVEYVTSGVEETVTTSSTMESADTLATTATSVAPGNGYFTFRPWFPVGTALMAGVPVILPPPSTFDEGNISASVVEGADARDDQDVQTPRTYAPGIGGVTFSIEPAEAAVYVDGVFVGSAGDYSAKHEPLLLKFGGYPVELRARGYLTERFTVYVTMGEVLPFSGSLVKD